MTLADTRRGLERLTHWHEARAGAAQPPHPVVEAIDALVDDAGGLARGLALSHRQARAREP